MGRVGSLVIAPIRPDSITASFSRVGREIRRAHGCIDWLKKEEAFSFHYFVSSTIVPHLIMPITIVIMKAN